MREIESLQKLHKAQDTIISLRCKMAGLKGKCMAVIEWPDMYTPEEVKWAKEMEAEIDEMLSPNQLKQLLSWLWVQFLLYLIYWKWEIYEEILNQLHTGCPWRTGQ